MQVRRYWACVEVKAGPDAEFPARVWGGSDVSEADARAQAQRRADRVDWDALARGERPEREQSGYAYTRGANPEAMLEEFLDENGSRAGAVTITRYGARVLNTATLAFVDIDEAGVTAAKVRAVDPEPGVGTTERRGFFAKLLGGVKGAGPADMQRAVSSRLRAWAGGRSGRGARLYRTAGGWRVLVTSPAMDPASRDTGAFMESLGCDPAYGVLCRAQESFRARLTPKPWRVPGVDAPARGDYAAYHDPGGAFLEWLARYEEACMGYATCELLDAFGANAPADETTARLITAHDDTTGVGTGLPLA